MFAAVLLMSGNGMRFQSNVPKQFLRIGGQRIYQFALKTLLASEAFERILLVCHPEYLAQVEAEIEDPRIQCIEGGNTRQESSFKALEALPKSIQYVLIHDAVRPFITQRIIEENLTKVQKSGAVDTCIPSTDTIVYGESQIESIPPRKKCFQGQTPQTFSTSLLREAHKKTRKTNASDDCQLVIDMGKTVEIAAGSPENIKITTSLDLFLAEQILLRRSIDTVKPTTDLNGKRFLLIGGFGAIGSSIAKILEDQGAKAICISRRTHPLLSEYDEKGIQAIFQELHQTHGPFDGLLNCQGLLQMKPMKQTSPKEIQNQLWSNFLSSVFSSKYCLLKPGAHIINFASSSYSRGREGYALYSAAKAALINFTQALAKEHPEYFINVVVPARCNTPMRRQNFSFEDEHELLQPETIAKRVIELLKADSVSGTMLEIKKI